MASDTATRTQDPAKAPPLYCTVCGQPLTMSEAEGGVEFQGVCGNGHRWVYVGEYLRRGDFAVFQVEGFQCDQERPYPEFAEAYGDAD